MVDLGSRTGGATLESRVDEDVWAVTLMEHLTSHTELEQAALDEYVSAAARTKSKALQYLVGLIVEDEVRHHRQFAAIADSLRHAIEFTDPRSAVPTPDFDRADATEVLATIERLLDKERQDKRELRELRRQLRTVENTTLWALLVEQMQRDTDKHIAILEFTKKHTKARTRSVVRRLRRSRLDRARSLPTEPLGAKVTTPALLPSGSQTHAA
jgi:rubrerythrin